MIENPSDSPKDRRSPVTDRIGAARYLGVSLRMLDALLSRGELPVIRIGRRICLAYKDLDAFLEKNREQEIGF